MLIAKQSQNQLQSITVKKKLYIENNYTRSSTGRLRRKTISSSCTLFNAVTEDTITAQYTPINMGVEKLAYGLHLYGTTVTKVPN